MRRKRISAEALCEAWVESLTAEADDTKQSRAAPRTTAPPVSSLLARGWVVDTARRVAAPLLAGSRALELLSHPEGPATAPCPPWVQISIQLNGNPTLASQTGTFQLIFALYCRYNTRELPSTRGSRVGTLGKSFTWSAVTKTTNSIHFGSSDGHKG